MGRVNGPLLVAVAAAACLACVALVSLHTSHTVELEAASSAQTRWAAEQKDYARDHPVFTRCASKLDMPEFVKVARAPLATNHLVPALLLPPACIWRLLWPLRVLVFPGVLLLDFFPTDVHGRRGEAGDFNHLQLSSPCFFRSSLLPILLPISGQLPQKVSK